MRPSPGCTPAWGWPDRPVRRGVCLAPARLPPPRRACRRRVGDWGRARFGLGGQVPASSPRFRSILDQFVPYKPGQRVARPDGRAFKLSSNENPCGPLPSVVQVIAEASADVNRYPDNGASALTEAIAERHNVPPTHIAVG